MTIKELLYFAAAKITLDGSDVVECHLNADEDLVYCRPTNANDFARYWRRAPGRRDVWCKVRRGESLHAGWVGLVHGEGVALYEVTAAAANWAET